jgi:hypothetical protein
MLILINFMVVLHATRTILSRIQSKWSHLAEHLANVVNLLAKEIRRRRKNSLTETRTKLNCMQQCVNENNQWENA